MHNLLWYFHLPHLRKPPNCCVLAKNVRNHCVRNCFVLYVSVHDVSCQEMLQRMRTVVMCSYVVLCKGGSAQISGAKTPRQVKFVWWLLNFWTLCVPLLQGCIQKFLNSPQWPRVQILQLSATKCHIIAICWVSLVSSATITLCFALHLDTCLL